MCFSLTSPASSLFFRGASPAHPGVEVVRHYAGSAVTSGTPVISDLLIAPLLVREGLCGFWSWDGATAAALAAPKLREVTIPCCSVLVRLH